MHVAIDLGENYTYLTCWEMGKQSADACIRVRIPGVSRFDPAHAGYPWGRESLRVYFSRLNREYLLPSRMIVESAAVSLPGIFNLNTRRTLLDVLEETLGLFEVNIIPRPIALINGFQMNNLKNPLAGDVMVIEAQELSFDFAFVSITERSGSTLEKQFTGSLSQAFYEAELIGFHSAEGWSLNHLLIVGDKSDNAELAEFIDSLPAIVNIIYEQELFTAAEGLYIKSGEHKSAETDRINVIYPYEFYLEKSNQDSAAFSLMKIPFDTANLELDCRGSYKLISLDTSSIYNLTDKENQAKFRIYELKAGSENYQNEPGLEQNIVLEIDSTQDDLPGRLEVKLDMAAASLYLDLNPDKTETSTFSPADFQSRLTLNQKKLFDLIRNNSSNPKLIADWENHLLSYDKESPQLTNHIETTLFHIYALLQLWHDK